MSDIQLVIKLDKDIVQGIIDGENDEPRNIVRSFQATIADAIKNGKTIPNGHGRLIDADNYIDKYAECGYLDDIAVDKFNTITQTILEADKEN